MGEKFSISYVPSKNVNWFQVVYGDQNQSRIMIINILSEKRSFLFSTFFEEKNTQTSTFNGDSDNEQDEVGGLFHISKNKKINVDDQEDYTLINQNNKNKNLDWNLDEVN